MWGDSRFKDFIRRLLMFVVFEEIEDLKILLGGV